MNENFELEFIDTEVWRDADPDTRRLYWYAQDRDKVERFLDRAEEFLTTEADHLQLDVDVI